MPVSGNLTKNLLKNASWLFSGGIGTAVFASVEAVVLARFLGIDQFGLFSLIIAYVGIVNGLVDLKSSEAVIRYVRHYWELGEKDKTLSFIKLFYIFDFLIGVLALVVCILLAGVANDLFIHSEESFQFILIYSISVLVSSVNRTSGAILRVFDRFKTIAFLKVLSAGLRVSLVCLSLLLGFGIKGVFISYVVAVFVVFLMLQITVFRVTDQVGLKRWTTAKTESLRVVIREVRSFVLTSTLVGFLSNAFSRQLPVLLLGHFAGHQAAGLYKIAIIFSRIIMKLRDPLVQVIYPPLVAARSHNSLDTITTIVSYSTKNVMKLFLPIGIIFFLFANEFIVIFFGMEYQPAASAMRIIVISEVLSGFYFWVDDVEMALDKLRQRIIRVTLCSVSYATALFVLIPSYSYEGAAIAKLALSILVLVFSFLLFNQVRNKNQSVVKKK